jgi:hypothetical protein
MKSILRPLCRERCSSLACHPPPPPPSSWEEHMTCLHIGPMYSRRRCSLRIESSLQRNCIHSCRSGVQQECSTVLPSTLGKGAWIQNSEAQCKAEQGRARKRKAAQGSARLRRKVVQGGWCGMARHGTVTPPDEKK